MYTMPCETSLFGIGADTTSQVKVVTGDNATFEIYVSDKALQSHSFFSWWAYGCDFTEFTSDSLSQEPFDGFAEEVVTVNATMIQKWSPNITQASYAIPPMTTEQTVPSITMILPCIGTYVGGWGITEPVATDDGVETVFEFALADTWQGEIGFQFSSEECGDPEVIITYKVLA